MPEAVEKAGVRENTIVIFTSDNGLEFIRPWNGPGWCSVGGAW
jgi:arylsulfatase